MIIESTVENSMAEIFTENGNREFDINMPLQMLFDEVITFISKTDFD